MTALIWAGPLLVALERDLLEDLQILHGIEDRPIPTRGTAPKFAQPRNTALFLMSSPMRYPSLVLLTFLLTGCAARSSRQDATGLPALDTTPEQARAAAIEVLEESGFRVRVDSD